MSIILNLCKKDQASTKNLLNSIDYHVVDGNIRSFNTLSKSDQEELTGLLILALDDADEWRANLDCADQLSRKFAKYMVTAEKDDLSDYLEMMKEESVKHFSEHLDDLIKAKSAEYENESNYRCMNLNQLIRNQL